MEKNTKKETGSFLTIEEHAQNAEISGSVFAAVMQSQGWATGKKVEKNEFEKAVQAFLNAPIGG